MRDAFPYPYTMDHAVQWLTHTIENTKDILFAIDINGEAVGGIGVMPRTDVYRKSAEIGYWLGEIYWGKGFATEAVYVMTEYALANTELVRIFAEVFERNKASLRVLEKSGYYLESIAKKAVIKNEILMDEYVMVRLKA